jgi:hypothetical protein
MCGLITSSSARSVSAARRRISLRRAVYLRLVNGGETNGPGLVRDDPGQLEHEDGDDTDEDKCGGPGDAFEFLILELEVAERLACEIEGLCSHLFFSSIARSFRPLHAQPAFLMNACAEDHG